MINITPEKVIRKGVGLLEQLKALANKGVRISQNPTLSNKIKSFLAEVKVAMEFIQQKLLLFTGLSNSREERTLRIQERLLTNQRDNVLVYARR